MGKWTDKGDLTCFGDVLNFCVDRQINSFDGKCTNKLIFDTLNCFIFFVKE